MSRKNKSTMLAQTKDGYQTKVWINRKTNTMLPTNWKLQAGTLAGIAPLTKRQENRRQRNAQARADYFRAHPVAA